MFQRPFRLDTDASAYGLGAALTEEIKALERVVAYFNTKFMFSGEKLIFCSKNIWQWLNLWKVFTAISLEKDIQFGQLLGRLQGLWQRVASGSQEGGTWWFCGVKQAWARSSKRAVLEVWYQHCPIPGQFSWGNPDSSAMPSCQTDSPEICVPSGQGVGEGIISCYGILVLHRIMDFFFLSERHYIEETHGSIIR